MSIFIAQVITPNTKDTQLPEGQFGTSQEICTVQPGGPEHPSPSSYRRPSCLHRGSILEEANGSDPSAFLILQSTLSCLNKHQLHWLVEGRRKHSACCVSWRNLAARSHQAPGQHSLNFQLHHRRKLHANSLFPY